METDSNEAGRDADEIYLHVGKALSKWNLVEFALCNIFVHAMVPNSRHVVGAAMSAYWAVVSTDARLKMVDVAVYHRSVGNPDLLKSWKLLCNKIRLISKKRNEIAHGLVINFFESEKGTLLTWFRIISSRVLTQLKYHSSQRILDIVTYTQENIPPKRFGIA